MDNRQRTQLNEVLKLIRSAKNNLVMSAMALDQMENFDNTVSAIKGTIGDLSCAEATIENSQVT